MSDLKAGVTLQGQADCNNDMVTDWVAYKIEISPTLAQRINALRAAVKLADAHEIMDFTSHGEWAGEYGEAYAIEHETVHVTPTTFFFRIVPKHMNESDYMTTRTYYFESAEMAA